MAKRQWRSLFEMERGLFIKKNSPKILWSCVQFKGLLVFVKDVTTEEKNLLTLKVECLDYMIMRNLIPGMKKEYFWGYSKSSLAYLIYNPHTEKVVKHRHVMSCHSMINLQ